MSGPLDSGSLAGVVTHEDPQFGGSLEQDALATFLIKAASRQEDGLAIFTTSETTYYIVIQVGCPVDIVVEPRNPEFHLGALLVQAGRLDWDKHKEAERLALENEMSYDTALVRLKHLTYQESLAAMQSRVVFVLGQMLQHTEGVFEYYFVGQFTKRFSTPPVSLGKIAFKYVFEQWQARSSEQLNAVIEPFELLFVNKVTPPPVPLGEIQLSKRNKRFWDVVLAQKSRVRAVPSVSNMGHQPTLALLLTLRDLGFLVFEHEEVADAGHIRGLALVKDKHKSIRHATHFEMLSVHWSAYEEIIEDAFKKRIEEFSLESFPEPIHDQIREQLDEIREAVKNAHDVLKDKKKRKTYREKIINSMQLHNGISLYYRKGDMAMLRRDVREANTSLLRVLELNPQHKPARAKLALLREAQKRAEKG